MALRHFDRPASITAALGPTNTGKTYRAIRRMIGHGSGILGLPLRLLARESTTACVGRSGTPKWRFSPVRSASFPQGPVLHLHHRGMPARRGGSAGGHR